MGRRAANQTAVAFAALGTLTCGLSNSMEMLIAARFVWLHSMLLVQHALTITYFCSLQALEAVECSQLPRTFTLSDLRNDG
jgi:MFS family permease